MMGLTIAVCVIGAVLVAAIVLGTYLFNRLESNVALLTECFLKYVNNPDEINIVEDYPVSKSKKNDIHFPNSEGF